MSELHVVTGAFGYSGRRIAQRLLDAGHQVRTLTNSPDRPNPFGGRIDARPFDFDNPVRLVESLRGAAVLYNTYWVRFSTAGFSQTAAVDNTLALFLAAKEAGVQRVVHVSITNPSEDSPLEYFRGKARLERALAESGLSYAILRPAVLFGGEDILVNNMAWTLRKFPLVPVFGNGQYRLRPIHVEDLAELAVAQGRVRDDAVLNAVGPEVFTYRGLLESLGQIIGKRRPVLGVPPRLGYMGAKIIGALMGDVMLTWQEVQGLMAGLLDVDSPPTGTTRLTEWARENAARLGVRYASELARRRDRATGY
jgi:NADH dehydrogenase